MPFDTPKKIQPYGHWQFLSNVKNCVLCVHYNTATVVYTNYADKMKKNINIILSLKSMIPSVSWNPANLPELRAINFNGN